MTAAQHGLLLCCLLGATAIARPTGENGKPASVVVGEIRVQLLSDSLVRLEKKGPAGFEDRNTFHVVDRNWTGTGFTTNADAREVVIRTANYSVHIPQDAVSLKGVRVEAANGQTLYHHDGMLENCQWLPGPAENPEVWSFADTPRLIPPPWELTPSPAGSARPRTSGWDLDNDAPDVYVFLPRGDYRQLRRDFLKLTGPTEMVPLYALGAFDSRWYDYSEATALQQIDDYRSRRIPLDVLVVDTGWRQGASAGYQVNTNLLPNLKRFFNEAHARNVRVMFNDHPAPVSKESLAPEELAYRYGGLSGLLDQGLDIWWFDRNWMVSLIPPTPQLKKEVWGMRMYHDMTWKTKPPLRPLIMANVDGIDNGIRKRPPDVAAHRFPIQWTGDIGPGYDFLQRAVENAVHAGVQALFPYQSEDLGGHVANPTPDQYIRWIEYGALSPVYRPHCTHDLMRMPWTFGPEAENVARRFLNLRYRLLPVFYAAARENYETGEPLLRRLDLDYPSYHEAGREDEYLIGNGILVAPILQGPLKIVPAEWLTTPQNQPGLKAEYFDNDALKGAPVLTRTDGAVNFNWGAGSPGPEVPTDHFSGRWTGTIEVPRSLGDVILATIEDDGARLWVDDHQLIDAWGGHDSALTEASAPLSAGVPHPLRLEYQDLLYNASIRLCWRPANGTDTTRTVWIPPGTWIDAWTGKGIAGPVTITNRCPLDQAPIYVKSGSILPLAPEMQFTGQRPWNPITLDVYPQSGQTNRTTLYEDDTLTTAYQQGHFRKTAAAVAANGANQTVQVTIDAAVGKLSGALMRRDWVIRLHRPVGWPENLAPMEANVNGHKTATPFHRFARTENAMPFGDKTGASDTDVYELTLSGVSVHARQQVEIAFGPSK